MAGLARTWYVTVWRRKEVGGRLLTRRNQGLALVDEVLERLFLRWQGLAADELVEDGRPPLGGVSPFRLRGFVHDGNNLACQILRFRGKCQSPCLG